MATLPQATISPLFLLNYFVFFGSVSWCAVSHIVETVHCPSRFNPKEKNPNAARCDYRLGRHHAHWLDRA